MQNLGSKERVVVKFKEGIRVVSCLRLWFESKWCFGNITKSGWF